MRRILVTDFDGTITERDFYALLMERGAPDFWGDYASGRLTHFEAMAAIFRHAPTDDAALADLLRDMRPDPLLGPSVRALREHGWDVAIVSAGSSWYIERLLTAAGVAAPVYASPGRIEPGRGLVLEAPTASPFFSPETGIDKQAVVRDARKRYGTVAFAGDGPPDLAPALMVEDDLRFARGWLERELRRRGRAFRPYRRWSDIAAMLAGGPICPLP